MNFKRNFLIAAFTAVAAIGMVGCDNHSNTQQQPAPNPPAAVQTAPVTAPVQQPVQPAPVKKGDTPEQKAAKLAAMEQNDVAVLAAMGYKANARTGMGYCPDGGAPDGSGYHGVSTAIQYDVQKADGSSSQHWEVCVAHKGGKPTVGQFRPMP
ncbi:MAG: hypothetical protein EPN97_14255 [Alphaproteobacteria bacterium]|nr:MAG: hypothetical protein EPN97_14255 [Alphaproteobacteria bacterium]